MDERLNGSFEERSPRDPARIPEVLRVLEQVWTQHPNMRLGQLLHSVGVDHLTEDTHALNRIQMLGQAQPHPGSQLPKNGASICDLDPHARIPGPEEPSTGAGNGTQVEEEAALDQAIALAPVPSQYGQESRARGGNAWLIVNAALMVLSIVAVVVGFSSLSQARESLNAVKAAQQAAERQIPKPPFGECVDGVMRGITVTDGTAVNCAFVPGEKEGEGRWLMMVVPTK